MPIVIETDSRQAQLDDSELEVIEIDDCTLEELSAVLKVEGHRQRLDAINKLCQVKPWRRTGRGGDKPGCGIGFIVNDPDANDPNPNQIPITLRPVSRQQTLAAIKGRVGNLHVGDTFRTGQLTRNIETATAVDRLVTVSKLNTGAKAEADVDSLWFCLVEIDDDSVFDAANEFGPSVLPGLASAHIETARLALGAFLREDGQAKADPPFYVCYSGRRSFHMLWQFGRPAMPQEIAVLKEGKGLLLRRLKELSPERQNCLPVSLKALSAIDTQAIFNPIAMARIPCSEQEEGRFPQIAWTTGAKGFLSLEAFLETARARIERYSHIDAMAAMQRRIWAFTAAPTPSGKITEADIDAAFPANAKKRRHGDGFAVRCPFHEDKTHSAFVSDSGFIYCSVCCSEGQKFIGRVRKGGEVEKCQ
jgi:hypothetical protein